MERTSTDVEEEGPHGSQRWVGGPQTLQGGDAV